MHTLKDLQIALKNENYDSHLLEPTDEFPSERLLAFIGVDYQQRERILEVTLQQQELAEGMAHPIPGYVRLQFQSTLSFEVNDMASNQVASLLLFLNHLLELPGFEMSEIDSKVRYRYVLLTDSHGVDAKVCFAIIGIIILILDLFTETIEKVAIGEMSFNELLENILQTAQKIKL